MCIFLFLPSERLTKPHQVFPSWSNIKEGALEKHCRKMYRKFHAFPTLLWNHSTALTIFVVLSPRNSMLTSYRTIPSLSDDRKKTENDCGKILVTEPFLLFPQRFSILLSLLFSFFNSIYLTSGWFNATLTAKVISWRSVTHMCFLAFSHQY